MSSTQTGTQIPERWAEFPRLGKVCRVGLATRGESALSANDVLEAVDRGVNYLNWCGAGHSDGLTEAVRQMGSRRSNVFVAVQFFARTEVEAVDELQEVLGELGTSYVDALTYYYVEHEQEWAQILGRHGAGSVVDQARAAGIVRAVGVTSHQRDLAASIAASGQVDMIMVRYNGAHRGAETEVFPVTARYAVPAVTYTGLRWGALLKATPDDPPEFTVPRAVDWYRFVLSNPAVTVALMAPRTSEELREDFLLLDEWQGLSPEELEILKAHGDRVHRHAGLFP